MQFNHLGLSEADYRSKDHVGSVHMPSPDQCRDVINKLQERELVIRWLCPSSALILLPSLIHYKSTLRDLCINCSPLTTDCIKYLCDFLTDNKTLKYLYIVKHSISDKGVISICQVLQNNSTLNILSLHNNPLITSASAPALTHLIRTNSTLSALYLFGTQLSLESLELIFQSLAVKSFRRLILDTKYEKYCTKNYKNLLSVLSYF